MGVLVNTAYIKHEASAPGPACTDPVHQPWDLLVRAESHCFPPLPFRVGGKEERKENETRSPDTVLSSRASDDQSGRFYKPLRQIAFIQRNEYKKYGNVGSVSSSVCIQHPF